MTTTERGPHTDSGQPTSDSGILRALEGAQPCDGVTHRPTSRSAGNGKATVTLTTPAAHTAVTGGGRPAEHRGRPQGVEVRVHGIGDHSTFSALGRPKYKELVDSRVWIGQVADEFTVYIPDRRGSGNKRALLAELNLCAWTAPQPYTTCTATDVELLLAHLKGQDSSLDTAISSDDERAFVVSSDPLLTVTEIFCQTPDRRCSPAVRLERFESVANDGDDPHLD